jgi:very-short-patch-repair endonuclease
MSELEETLLFQMRAVGLPEPEREAQLVPGRKFKVDFYWPAHHLVVEVEGGIYGGAGGAHSRPANIIRDIEKYNALALLGYKVLRVHSEMVRDGRALTLVERALNGEERGTWRYALGERSAPATPGGHGEGS